MQHFILGNMMESKGKFSSDANTVLMWINTHKSNSKYSKGFIPVRQSLEPELQVLVLTALNCWYPVMVLVLAQV